MKQPTPIYLLALALGACGNNQSPAAPSKGADPAAPTVAGKQEPAPTPAPSGTPTFASRINSASVATDERVDATALGAKVEAYLVTRYGAPGLHDDQAQQFDLSLVLLGDGKSVSVALGHYEEIFDKSRPFGDLEVEAPFGTRAYNPDNDAFNGAPKLKTQAPIVLATSKHDLSGDTLAFVVTQEKGALVVWYAENVYEEGSSEAWDKDTTITLASGATVSAPIPGIEPPAAMDPLPVHVIERVTSEGQGYRSFDLALQVGDRVGPVDQPQVKASQDAEWALAVSAADLPSPAPKADGYLASRSYADGERVYSVLLTRVGDELVMWDRLDDGAPGEWSEFLHVPVPAGAKLDVR